jgi:hypothetical protein
VGMSFPATAVWTHGVATLFKGSFLEQAPNANANGDALYASGRVDLHVLIEGVGPPPAGSDPPESDSDSSAGCGSSG